MPEGGMSMLRRVFLSPAIIESYSPDPQYRVRRPNESTNRVEEVCPETGEISLIDISIAGLIWKSYNFTELFT
jgi:hypothetical protein